MGLDQHRLLTIILSSLLLLVTMTACSETTLPPVPVTPGEFRGLAAFERGDDVYLQAIGGAPTRLMVNASFPRWSPDGKSLGLVSGQRIIRIDTGSKKQTTLARAKNPRAVAWHPNGQWLFFSDGNLVRTVNVNTGETRVAVQGYTFRELDISPDGKKLVATVRHNGVKIRLFDFATGKSRLLSSGCSASFSPDGSLVSKLHDGHRGMDLLASATGKVQHTIESTRGIRYDNHFWTNHPDWIAGEVEGGTRDVVLINSRTGEIHRITDLGDAGRADVFLKWN